MPSTHTVAVLSESAALLSVLGMVLASDRRLRVREFDNRVSLRAYMNIAPVAIIVCDGLHIEGTGAFVGALRGDPEIAHRGFRAIGLTREITESVRRDTLAYGIEDVLVMPISPSHLLERVTARLNAPVSLVRTPAYAGPDRRRGNLARPETPRPGRRFGDNVIELFPGNA